MAKYNYDKKVLKGLGVGSFLGEVGTRNAAIDAAPDTIPTSIYNANILAGKLHPHVQFGKVRTIYDHGGAKTYILEPDEEKGCSEFAYFRAGQYVSVALTVGGTTLNKPYTLSSNPGSALGESANTYAITVKRNKAGFASDYILDTWEVGTKVTMSAPLGEFYYTRLRDAKNIVALAGGSGITPFLSMAYAIADGIEDFNLTILYGSTGADNILLKEELDRCEAKAGGKVKVVHVLSDEEADGFEHGFITAELIKKYAPDDYSIFVCGPKAMYKFEREELAKLDLPRRRIRFELSGEFGDPAQDPAYPAEAAGREFKVKVLVRGEESELSCRAEQTLISAIEAAGIRVPSDCRSGECGWCHSRLIKGDVFVPASADGRRAADKKFGWIHPCASYPLSDIEIEVFPLLEGKK